MAAKSRARGVWWISPAGPVLLLIPATLWLAWHMSDQQYREIYGTPKALTTAGVTLLSAAVLAFLLGAIWPTVLQRRVVDPPAVIQLPEWRWRLLRRAAEALFWLTVAGYAAFVVSGLINGVTVGQVRDAVVQQSNYDGNLKALFASVAGITTLTQVGIAYVVVATVLLLARADVDGREHLKLKIGVVLCLATVRAFLLTERLALLEIVLPSGILIAFHAARVGSQSWGLAVRASPVIMIPALLVFFGAFEYSRSWVYHSSRTQHSFVEFTTLRLAGYYVTSYNNGQILLNHEPHPGRLPYDTVAALWEAPGVEQWGGRAVTEDHARRQNGILVLHGNPEYNAEGGLAVPFVDYGIVGGFLVLFVAGSVVGIAYRGFYAGNVPGVLLYPVLVASLFELPRYFPWTQGRIAPALVALAVTSYFARDRVIRHARGVS